MGDIILTGFWLIASALGIVLGLAVYGLPTIIAVVRKSPNIALIATVNLVLGGLFVPWWIALAMALWSSGRQGDVTVIQTTNVPPAPHVVLSGVAQPGAHAPVQGALPAAPSAQPPDQPLTQPAAQSATQPPPMLSPSQAGEREDGPRREQSPSSPGPGFAPPAPYSEAPSASPARQLRASDQGW